MSPEFILQPKSALLGTLRIELVGTASAKLRVTLELDGQGGVLYDFGSKILYDGDSMFLSDVTLRTENHRA